MMLDKVLEPDSLRATEDGFTVKLRLPWYRSLPLSTVDVDEVKLDGETIPLEKLSFRLGHEEWPVGEMRRLTDRNWFVLDSAELRVSGHPMARGGDHEIGVTVSLYPPYIRGLRRPSRWTRTMTAH